MRSRRCATVALVLAVVGARAAADPAPAAPAPAAADPAPTPAPATPGVFLHIASSSHLVTSGGTSLDLPPGYFYDEQKWGAMDVEYRRLQDAETRLTAQNKSYEASASSWQPGWKTLGAAFLTGLAAGVYVRGKL